ncbi:hypothetical protein H7J86_00140, partial [Mycobacterium hackensackense]|nr:hypothetical protein [Mycobacterium hackensackense]
MTISTGHERPGAELVTWLAALRTLSARAGAETDLPEVLCLVADTARTLLGFDFCGVLVPDAARERLEVGLRLLRRARPRCGPGATGS